jgi:hypothetical protein
LTAIEPWPNVAFAACGCSMIRPENDPHDANDVPPLIDV